jgi:hypothetical protein
MCTLVGWLSYHRSVLRRRYRYCYRHFCVLHEIGLFVRLLACLLVLARSGLFMSCLTVLQDPTLLGLLLRRLGRSCNLLFQRRPTIATTTKTTVLGSGDEACWRKHTIERRGW